MVAVPSIPGSPAPLPKRLSPDQVIARLKRFQAFELHSARLLGGWLPGIEKWEIKHEVALHLWQDMQHSRELRTRLWELRVMNPDRPTDPDVAQVAAGLSLAQSDDEFLAGHYLGFKAALLAAYHSILADTHAVYDAPTIALIRRLLPEKEAQLEWARRELLPLPQESEKSRQIARWLQWIQMLLAQVGGLAGADARTGADNVPPPGYSCLLPFGRARRDGRFQMSPTGLPLPAEDDDQAKVLFQFFNYSQEMQAAETLGSLLWETDGMEWEFYHDVARHCYDEERHSALGENRLHQRYTALTYVIEADGFKYKHETYREHLKREDTESAEAVLYDIIDETSHVRFGQKWVPKLMEHAGYREPLDKLVTECREIVLTHSASALQRAAAQQRIPAPAASE